MPSLQSFWLAQSLAEKLYGHQHSNNNSGSHGGGPNLFAREAEVITGNVGQRERGERQPFSRPEAAERKLLELANAIKAVHEGRVPVGEINMQFRKAGGTSEYRAAVAAAIAHGCLTLHPSGGYLSFTLLGVALFAQCKAR
jgi:hypothetical protein